MTLVAGVDGCPAGWLCITRDLYTGKIESAVFPDAHTLVFENRRAVVMCVDIPIGLTESGRRACDGIARGLLGEPRRRSVFPAPVRPALHAETREEADRITRSVDGRGVGAQAFAIYERVRQMDAVLSEKPGLQDFVREIHPELCFMEWNGGVPMRDSKRTPEGKAARARLVGEHFGDDARESVRDAHRVRLVADDDIHDSFAALWTAERICRGKGRVKPEQAAIDVKGLRMEMWY
jgi:predicted RNase H-like nuclease